MDEFLRELDYFIVGYLTGLSREELEDLGGF